MDRQKQFSLRFLFLLLLAAAIAMPFAIQAYRYLNPLPFFNGPTTTLCVMSSSDAITQAHVSNLLSQNGINSITEGSKIYGTVIEESKLEKAVALLESSQAENLVSLKSDANGTIWVSRISKPVIKFNFNLSIDDFDPQERSEANELVFAIRDRALSTYLSSAKLPIVKSVRYQKRSYLNENGDVSTGYEVELHLADRIESPTAEFKESYQVYDQYQTVIGSGGSGWGDLPD